MFIVKAILIIVHVVVSLLLVVTILMQSSKGGGLSAAFGGQGSTTLFGPRGTADILAKLTRYLGAGFLILSFTLSMLAGQGSAPQSVTQKVLNETPAANLPEVNVDDIDFGSPAGGTTGEADLEPLPGGETETPSEGAGEAEIPIGGDQSGTDEK